MSVSIIHIVGSVYIIISHHFLRCLFQWDMSVNDYFVFPLSVVCTPVLHTLVLFVYMRHYIILEIDSIVK